MEIAAALSFSIDGRFDAAFLLRGGTEFLRPMLAALWVCFLVRGVFYASILPLWEGYDEWSHFAFIQHLSTHGSLPDRADRVSREIEESMRLVPLPREMRHWPPPYATHDEYWKMPAGERGRRERELRWVPPAYNAQPAADPVLIYEALQPPLYYLTAALALKPIERTPLPQRALLVRLLGVLWASAAVPLGFLIARRCFGADRPALGTAAATCAMPGLMLNVARAGNEGLSVALFSLLIYLTLLQVSDLRLRRAWFAGAVLGLGLITKAYFLTAVPAVAVVHVWQWWKQPARRRAVALSAAIYSGAALALSGWWYLRNLALSGTLSGLSESVILRDLGLLERLAEAPRVSWARAVDAIWSSHIWYGAWSGLKARSWIYHLCYGAILLAALGLVRFHGSHRPGFKTNDTLPVLEAFYGCFWLGQLYNVLLLFLSKGASTSMGWYMYAVIAAQAVLIGFGLLELAPRGLRPAVLPAVVLGAAALDLYTIHFLLIPYWTGLTADGAPAFRMSQLRAVGVEEVFRRLAVNKSEILRAGVIAGLWVSYLAATLGAIALAGVASRLRRIGEAAPPGA
jgi:hypothetical protein